MHSLVFQKPAENNCMVGALLPSILFFTQSGFSSLTSDLGADGLQSTRVMPEMIQAQIELGGKIAKEGRGPDRLNLDARWVVGKWFDGSRQQEVEELVFLTPGLLSRWIGFEGIDGAEAKNLWGRFWDQMIGKQYAFLRLARLDWVDWHDGDTQASADPSALDNVRVLINTRGNEWKSLQMQKIQDLQDRSPQLVLRDKWFQVIPSFVAWPSAVSKFPLVSEIRWGKNRLVSYMLEFPVNESNPKLYTSGGKGMLKIIEGDRSRIVKFNYPRN
jgi:hypothetical protein